MSFKKWSDPYNKSGYMGIFLGLSDLHNKLYAKIKLSQFGVQIERNFYNIIFKLFLKQN